MSLIVSGLASMSWIFAFLQQTGARIECKELWIDVTDARLRQRHGLDSEHGIPANDELVDDEIGLFNGDQQLAVRHLLDQAQLDR